MKILNLFSGIGGNRTGWGNSHQITAVEFDQEISEVYRRRFPEDIIYVGDAYEYLVENYEKFDFIWASPPCQSHSQLNNFYSHRRLPDFQLYSIIIFLQKNFKGKFVVENVIPFYAPLIKPSVEIARHYFWTNFTIPEKNIPKPTKNFRFLSIEELSEFHKIPLDMFGEMKRSRIKTLLRNCVDWRVGKYILSCAQNERSLDRYILRGGNS